MKTLSVRQRSAALVAFVATISLVAAACVPPPPPPSPNFSFRANQVTVVDNNEWVAPLGCVDPIFGVPIGNCYDEPYVINIWFRVTLGQPGSASAGVVDTRQGLFGSGGLSLCAANRQPPCPGPATANLPSGTGPGSGGTVTFNNVPRPDVVDLLNSNNKITVTGVWSWAMEEDLFGTAGTGSLANILQNVLNDTLASNNPPSDADALVQLIVDNLGSAIALGGSALLNALAGFTFGAGDDLLGSRMYVFVGSRGTLAGLIDGASPDLAGFNLGVSAAGIPDVLGISVRSTNPQSLTNQVFNQDGTHRYNYVTANP